MKTSCLFEFHCASKPFPVAQNARPPQDNVAGAKRRQAWRLGLVCGAALLLLGLLGCSTTSEDESSTPWNVPQPWENSVPMGTP